ncbi:MAG: 3-dehydroquinate synthase [Spirochaetaceae bacterium]|jgi:3-dehydroquinate synthase|nr:3-dehydroquinate synthase [Spirochaetaceae bacterium]
MNREYTFSFGGNLSSVRIRKHIPSLDDIISFYGSAPGNVLFVCDTHTRSIARQILGEKDAPLCEIQSGEAAKNWASVETILKAAKDAALGRDGLFVGVGGGVVSDMTGFAASIYMRGAGLCLVSTSLLGMVDAAVGGKTGFDLFGMKNFAGTFYPAPLVYMPVSSLTSLPEREWKSGMAEIIKTATLDTSDEQERFWSLLAALSRDTAEQDILVECIARSVQLKGRVVEADPKETGNFRALLNLGHTFGHALESSIGLGQITHGEAVAWGMARSCDLGLALGITPQDRREKILALLSAFGYETKTPHPLMRDTEAFMQALRNDKKKKAGSLRFIVPARTGAVLVSGEQAEPRVLARIIGGYSDCL